ncbi:MAG: YbaB/EbfC family nucleoid-associated protein [Rickettsiales bacterium]
MNMQQVMKQAQMLQSKMEAMQKKMEDETVEGQSGGGMVKVIVTCKGEAKSIEIDPSIISVEEKELMQDLIIAAFNNAKDTADTKMNSEMQKMSSSMGLPAGFKLPF